jgi:hypothetical protein
MKYILLLIIIVALYSCDKHNRNRTPGKNELVYRTDDASEGPLSAKLYLTGEIMRSDLKAQITLKNSGSDIVGIQEIVFSTTEGVRSLAANGGIPFLLKPGTDSTITLKFHPLGDLNSFRATGLQGSLKPVYKASVTYKIAGNDNVLTLALKSQADKVQYTVYTKNYKKVTGYSFNTKAGFNQKQKKYLETLKQITQPPFVYLSEQEIAVSGLNFRFKGYYLKDTLHAEMSIVNHSEFPMKIIPEALDVVNDGTDDGGIKLVNLQKVSGSTQTPAIMEKGDRVLIHFKKHMKIRLPEKVRLTMHLRDAFMLTGQKPLFNDDVELIPVIF